MYLYLGLNIEKQVLFSEKYLILSNIDDPRYEKFGKCVEFPDFEIEEK